jgi:hypothetical protein
MHPDTIDINIDLPGGRMPASHEAGSGGPLDGIHVLDLSSVVMGPLATQILGDLGADVITVETRDGDINRIMGSGPYPGLSGVSLNLLRNKRNGWRSAPTPGFRPRQRPGWTSSSTRCPRTSIRTPDGTR